MPCGLQMPGLAQSIWSDLLGLPTNLDCPQTGGILEPLCGGVSPIMDAESVRDQCLAQVNGSMAGKTVHFFSPVQMIPGWGQDPMMSVGEFTGGLAAKYGILSTAANAGQPAVQTLTTDAWSLVGPIESSVSWVGGKALSLGKAVMPMVYLYAGVLDLLSYAGCDAVARQQAGQMTPTPVGGGAIP